MIALSVNLNKIALIRNSREGNFPDLLQAAHICIAAGAQGITIHPRSDQRHIRPHDAVDLKREISVELNIEGNPFAEPQGDYPGFMAIVRQVRPAQCTLVPDSHSQLTSDHGWDLLKEANRLKPIIAELKDLDCRISLFMDADTQELSLAREIGANRIELYTGPYAAAFSEHRAETELSKLLTVAKEAEKLDLGLNAGHDLNLQNLPLLVTLPHLLEVSIGHALVADALECGLENTVKAYIKALKTST